MAGYYGKRPLWQWILIYVVIGVVIYGIVYYFFFYKKGTTYNYQVPSQTTPTKTSIPANNAPQIRYGY